MAIGLVALGLTGCQKAESGPYVLAAATQALPAAAQADVAAILQSQCGTSQAPRMLGAAATPVDTQHFALGQAVYVRRCVQCHGPTGDGNGPVAQHLYPRPRDYRSGTFKFTSTPSGVRARRDDLKRTLKLGVPGTSMPSFKLVPDKELEAVLDYVLLLTHRGELELQLVNLVKAGDEIPPAGTDRDDLVKELSDSVLSRWRDAETEEVLPLSPQPRFTEEHVRRGQVAFQKRECFKCHGSDGRAQSADALKSRLTDEWGQVTRAADLTSGMLHGGARPLDVYRRIHSGVKGTPMPGHALMLAGEPDTLWDLTAFVLHVASERRRHHLPESGELIPLPSVSKP